MRAASTTGVWSPLLVEMAPTPSTLVEGGRGWLQGKAALPSFCLAFFFFFFFYVLKIYGHTQHDNFDFDTCTISLVLHG
jgi:hypothetical protein